MTGAGPARAIGALRRFARRRAEVEWCDLCAAPLRPVHDHVVERDAERLRCACAACVTLLTDPPRARWRRVRPRVTRVVDPRLGESQWAALGAPIDLAFFVRTGAPARVVMRYPSPAGAIQADVDPDAWDIVSRANPAVRDLQPDVEALLVDRTGVRHGCYVVSIDVCYRLVGTLRRHWHGLDGGPAVREGVREFFADLDGREDGA